MITHGFDLASVVIFDSFRNIIPNLRIWRDFCWWKIIMNFSVLKFWWRFETIGGQSVVKKWGGGQIQEEAILGVRFQRHEAPYGRTPPKPNLSHERRLTSWNNGKIISAPWNHGIRILNEMSFELSQPDEVLELQVLSSIIGNNRILCQSTWEREVFPVKRQ